MSSVSVSCFQVVIPNFLLILREKNFIKKQNKKRQRKSAGDRTWVWKTLWKKLIIVNIFNNVGLHTFYVTSSNIYLTWRSVWSLLLHKMTIFGQKFFSFFGTFGYRKDELRKPRFLHKKGQEEFSYLTCSVMSQFSKSNFLPCHYRNSLSHFSSSEYFRTARTENMGKWISYNTKQATYSHCCTSGSVDVWSHFPGKLRVGCWIAPCHKKVSAAEAAVFRQVKMQC